MTLPIACAPQLPTMRAEAVDKVRSLEAELREQEQVPITTTHHFHAGLYSRTVCIPKGVIITGVLIRIPTLLVISGHASVFTGEGTVEVCGYHIVPAGAGRKQVFYAHEDTHLTMTFATKAQTVEEAEAEFTLESHLLMSKQCGENTINTGETICPDSQRQ